MNKITVLLSSYKGTSYIDEQICSILKQKDVNVKLTIRDDGSDDPVLNKKLEKYESQDVKIFYQDNIGYKKSFISLVKNASLDSDYYSFSDQDDVWNEDKLVNGIKSIEKINGPAVYCSKHKYVDEKLQPLKGYHTMVDDLPCGNIDYRTALIPGNYALGCTMIWNRKFQEILKSVNYNDFDFGHDNLISNLAPLVGDFIKSEEESLLYRQHGNNVGGRKKQKMSIRKKIKAKFNNLNNMKNYELRVYIQKNFSKFIPKEKIKFLNDSITYKKNLISKIKFIKQDYEKELNYKEKRKFIIKVLFGTF